MGRNQDPQDELWALLSDALNNANKNRNEKGIIVFDGQRPDEADYGISPKNPLCSTSLAGTDAYLSRLRTSEGKKFTWQRIGDVRADCNGVADIGMDKYQLYLDGKPHQILYFVPYVGESTAVPHGMRLCDITGAQSEEAPKHINLEHRATRTGQKVKVSVKRQHTTTATDGDKMHLQTTIPVKDVPILLRGGGQSQFIRAALPADRAGKTQKKPQPDAQQPTQKAGARIEARLMGCCTL